MAGGSWWAARAKSGEVAPGFSRDEILRPAKEDPGAEGGVFGRIGTLLRELSAGVLGADKILCCSNLGVRHEKASPRRSRLPCRASRRHSVQRLRDILEQVLVKVNGDIITKTDLETRQIAAIRGRINSQVDADALKNDAQLKTDAGRGHATDSGGRDRRAADDPAREGEGLSRSPISSSRTGSPTSARTRDLDDEQKFQAALKQEGMSMEELRRNFERQVVIYRVQQDEVGPKLQITEEEARQYSPERTSRNSSRRRRSRSARS